MTNMASVVLGDHFNSFIAQQIQSGRFSSATEVVEAALALFEQEEHKKRQLIEALKKGEASGFVENLDRRQFLEQLHLAHNRDEL